MQLQSKSAITSATAEKIFAIEWNSWIEYFTHRFLSILKKYVRHDTMTNNSNCTNYYFSRNRDELKIHTWDAGNAKDGSIKVVPLSIKGTQILDIDCMSTNQQSTDQRKKSSEIFCMGTSDGTFTSLCCNKKNNKFVVIIFKCLFAFQASAT